MFRERLRSADAAGTPSTNTEASGSVTERPFHRNAINSFPDSPAALTIGLSNSTIRLSGINFAFSEAAAYRKEGTQGLVLVGIANADAHASTPNLFGKIDLNRTYASAFFKEGPY